MDKRSRTCCFTGHRNIPSAVLPVLSAELDRTTRALIADGIQSFETGGARGFDTLAAETVLRLRREFPQIRLILVLPCRNQTRGWKPDDARRYEAVLKEAFFSKASDLVELSQLVDDIRIGPFGTMLHKEDYILNGIPVINPQHIKKLAICESPRVTISAEKADELAAYKLQVNDVIMGRRGEMGRVAAVGERESGWICGTGSILFRLKPEFDANLYVQILSSPKTVHYLEKHATGTTMKNLNEDIVKHIPVPRIDRAEQASIMQRTDSTLSVCDNTEQTVAVALRQSEAMRQSILKRAFEGEL